MFFPEVPHPLQTRKKSRRAAVGRSSWMNQPDNMRNLTAKMRSKIEEIMFKGSKAGKDFREFNKMANFFQKKAGILK